MVELHYIRKYHTNNQTFTNVQFDNGTDKKVLFTFSTKTRAFQKRFILITKRFYLIIQSVSFPIFLHRLWIIRLWNYSSSKRVIRIEEGINFVIDFFWDAAATIHGYGLRCKKCSQVISYWFLFLNMRYEKLNN